jgi:hypothetical protein
MGNETDEASTGSFISRFQGSNDTNFAKVQPALTHAPAKANPTPLRLTRADCSGWRGSG